MASGGASSVVVTGCGVRSPVGATFLQTGASVRAGITRLREHPWYTCTPMDPEWDAELPLVCSAMPDLDELLDDPERLVRPAVDALREALSALPLRRAELPRGALLLVFPDDRALAGITTNDELLQRVVEASGLWSLGTIRAIGGGQAAGFLALKAAATLLRSNVADFCIVGCVDSYLLDARLAAIDAEWRLKSERNADGFLPGEAAAFLVLEAAPRVAARTGAVLAHLGPVGLGAEPNTLATKKASSGAGLATAIRTALGGTTEIPWVLCDLNGESHRAFEWGVVLARLAQPLENIARLTHPADCLGDVGAASCGVLVACAIHGFQRGYAPGTNALLWCASDDGTRAAVLARRPATPAR